MDSTEDEDVLNPTDAREAVEGKDLPSLGKLWASRPTCLHSRHQDLTSPVHNRRTLAHSACAG